MEAEMEAEEIELFNRLERKSLTPTVNLIRLEYSLDPVIRTYLDKMRILANPVKLESVDLGSLSNETIGNICPESNDESAVGSPKRIKSERCEDIYDKTWILANPVKLESVDLGSLSNETIGNICPGSNDESVVGSPKRIKSERCEDIYDKTWILANPVKLESVDLGSLSNETIGNICPGSNDESVVGSPKRIKSERCEDIYDKTWILANPVKLESVDLGSLSNETIGNICPGSNDESVVGSPKRIKSERCEDIYDKTWILANPVKLEPVDLGSLSNETIGNICPESNDESAVGSPKSIKTERCEDIYDKTSLRKIQMTTNSSDRCQKSFAHAMESAGQDCDDVRKDPFQGELCQKRFPRKSNSNRRMEAHPKERPHQCIICSKRFYNKRSLKTHMFVHSGTKPYQCDICQKPFNRSGNLKQHMLTHTGQKLYQCDNCEKSFNRSDTLKQHMLTHFGEKSHQCDICRMSFKQSSHLKRHTWTHTGEKRYQCDICQKTFVMNADLKRHMFTHTGEKPYQCNICQKSFNRNATLKLHMLTHTGEKSYQCDICQKSFNRNSTLEQHMLTHTEEKPHQCDICQKSFKRNSTLKRHILTHTEEKPYQCDICQKTFVQNGDLKRHMLTHTEEKPYQCDVCQKDVRSERFEEVYVHSYEEKPLHCDICQKIFNQSDHLEQHMLTHTGGKPHQCDV